MAALGYGSTVELVRAITRIPRSEARARISAAADVLPGRGLNGAPIQPKLPTTAAAVADAAIGAADVAVIRSILARIPPRLGEDTRTEVEAELARHARTLPASWRSWAGGSWPTSIRTVTSRTTRRRPAGHCASATATGAMNSPDGSTGKPPRSSARR